MKPTADRPYSDPEKAAGACWNTRRRSNLFRKGRIYIEKLNGPFLFGDKATPAEYSVGLELAISRGWLKLYESCTFVKLTQSGADMFA